jgi:PII-like signaling protein
MDNYMLMERQRSSQAKEATVFRSTPGLGRDERRVIASANT